MTPSLHTVSVIVPVFNGASRVEDALASVHRQTVQPLEVLLVDDGSTDDSLTLLRRLAEESPGVPLRVIQQGNSGQSAARNRAVQDAQGTVLAFLDQDDRWSDDHLEVLLPPLEADSRIGLSYGDFDEIDANGNYVTRNFLAAHHVAQNRNTIVEWVKSDTMILPSAALVRASAFREIGGFDPRLVGYEDDDLWIRMFRAGWLTASTAHSVAAFRVHAGSSSTRASFRESRVVFYRNLCEAIPDDPVLRRYYISDTVRPRLVRAAVADLMGAARRGAYGEAKAVAETIEALTLDAREPVFGVGIRWAMRHPRFLPWLVGLRRALPWRRRDLETRLIGRRG